MLCGYPQKEDRSKQEYAGLVFITAAAAAATAAAAVV